MVQDLVRKEVRNLEPYEPMHIENVIKLDANENPFRFPAEVLAKLGDELKSFDFARYPDPWADRLRVKIAEYTGVKKEQILAGNGSDELITILLQTFGGEGKVVITPPSFVMYSLSTVIAGSENIAIPLKENFEIDWPKVIAEGKKDETKVIFICSPNNPTGNTAPLDKVEELLQETKAIVVLDEAYYEFAGKTGVELLDKYPNLIILRTFSKAFGIAGLRVGYLMTSQEVLRELGKVKPPYNLNSFSQRVAELVLENLPAFNKNIAEINKLRDTVYKEMQTIEGVEVFPTEANFILFRTKFEAQTVFDELLKGGVLVRNMSKGPGLKNCLRVTIGTEEENQVFLGKLRDILR